MPEADPLTPRFRVLLGAVLTIGVVGTGAELLLLEHWEEGWQLVPLVLLGSGAFVVPIAVLRPRRWSVRALRWLMVGYVLAGAVGVQRHFQGNEEFELEMRPALGGFELLSRTLTGATPALAPGALSFLGLVGLALTYRHPRLSDDSSSPSDPGASR
jgi:hypothetical protein